MFINLITLLVVGWSSSQNGDKDSKRREHKGWLVMIHDLFGSTIVFPSIVTTFVISTCLNHVFDSIL